MRFYNKRYLLFLCVIIIILGTTELTEMFVMPSHAAVIMYPDKMPGYWHNTAVVIVKIAAASVRQRLLKQFKSPVIGSLSGPVQVHVLAVLATEKTVKTDMTIYVTRACGDNALQGPISYDASGTFLIIMTRIAGPAQYENMNGSRRHYIWLATGNGYRSSPHQHYYWVVLGGGAGFRCMQDASAKIMGLSDPLVKKVAAEITKFRARAGR